jgi:predicted NAD/FAD-binding protein
VQHIFYYLRYPVGSPQAPETTTLAKLQKVGFSQEMIDSFFRPFLGGIFFDPQLNVSSRLFMFVMRMLALGSNCLPAAGIGSIVEQLASGLPAASLRTGV